MPSNGDGEASDAGEAGAPSDSATTAADSATVEDATATDSATGAVFADRVVEFTPGAGAGFGQSRMPGIVLGAPEGAGDMLGSTHVVSLGRGGRICLAMAAPIVDGPGADFIVFENPFWPGGDATRVFAELGEVSVSSDGESWHVFACDTQGTGGGRYPGCAGWTPTLAYDRTMTPLDPGATGGDAFDLAVVTQASARYVRIRDLSTTGAGTTAGFDLDAVGVIHRGP